MNIVIPMAGLGSRFQNAGVTTPKPLIVVDGKTLIEHSVDSLGIDGKYIFITRVYDDPQDNERLTSILKMLKPDSVEIKIDKMQYFLKIQDYFWKVIFGHLFLSIFEK